jgi:hypothetical protein
MNTAAASADFRSKTLALCIASSALLLGVAALRWSLVDILTPFLLIPIEGVVWLLFACVLLASVVAAVRHRSNRLKALLPLAVCAAALTAVLSVPFTQIWLSANFHLKRQAREHVVHEMLAGTLRPNVQHNRSLVALLGGASVSAGGNEVVTHDAPTGKFVFFFTYRGILNSASGFLWVPSGASPEQFAELNGPIAEAIQYAQNWYFISMAP